MPISISGLIEIPYLRLRLFAGAAHDTPLVASLRTYLSHNRSLKAAAEALHVHKQSVIYRMRRVEELNGRRLGHIEDVAKFWLALRTLDLLGQGDSQRE
jgi:purine catabolism regulator